MWLQLRRHKLKTLQAVPIFPSWQQTVRRGRRRKRVQRSRNGGRVRAGDAFSCPWFPSPDASRRHPGIFLTITHFSLRLLELVTCNKQSLSEDLKVIIIPTQIRLQYTAQNNQI